MKIYKLVQYIGILSFGIMSVIVTGCSKTGIGGNKELFEKMEMKSVEDNEK